MRSPALAALLAAALLAACGEAEVPVAAGEKRVVEGAVLLVDDVPIDPAEVDRVAAIVGELYPSFVQRHRRRLALTNVVLPRAAAEARFPAEREAARRAAEEAHAALERGEALDGQTTTGHWESLGIETWSRLREREGWSEPFEDAGRFLLVRPVSGERRGPRVGQVFYTLEMLSFPYLGSGEATMSLHEVVDASRLRVLDPAWGELVPETWKHRMRGPDR